MNPQEKIICKNLNIAQHAFIILMQLWRDISIVISN